MVPAALLRKVIIGAVSQGPITPCRAGGVGRRVGGLGVELGVRRFTIGP